MISFARQYPLDYTVFSDGKLPGIEIIVPQYVAAVQSQKGYDYVKYWAQRAASYTLELANKPLCNG